MTEALEIRSRSRYLPGYTGRDDAGMTAGQCAGRFVKSL